MLVCLYVIVEIQYVKKSRLKIYLYYRLEHTYIEGTANLFTTFFYKIDTNQKCERFLFYILLLLNILNSRIQEFE